MDNRELYRIAAAQLNKAYAPSSKFHVGAALLAEDGRVFTGVNVENASYGGAICAERTAFVKAVSEGCREFKAIAIVSSAGSAWPCGICRQFMSEFADGDFKIISGDVEVSIEVYTMEEMLPKGFKL